MASTIFWTNWWSGITIKGSATWRDDGEDTCAPAKRFYAGSNPALALVTRRVPVKTRLRHETYGVVYLK